MMRSLATFLAASAIFGAGALPLAAQDAPDAPAEPEAAESADAGETAGNGDTIVVTGEIMEIARDAVRRQARDITVPTGSIYREPLARFEDALCPGVGGMSPDYASQMVDRIRANARALDLRVQGDGCSPNFLVVFTPDSQATMRSIMDDSRTLFDYTDLSERRAMLQPGPVRVFARVVPHTRDGTPMASGNGGEVPTASMWSAHSRIYSPIRNDITMVFVMIDMDAAQGKSLVQLADYATIRGLAQTKPVDDPTMDSILTLFQHDGPHADTLTQFDRAYLHALYDHIPNLPAVAKIGGVSRQLRILANEADSDE